MATVVVELDADHPGHADAAYRERRAAIAEVGHTYVPGQPIPDVTYTAEEDEVWRIVSTELAAKHRRLACAEVAGASDRLVLPAGRVPQLREVDARVFELTGFHFRPVAGLVPAPAFYAALADRTFLSTQYIRHHSTPRYTPEPDVVHEIVGHATMLSSPVFASLYEKAGRASLRATDPTARDFFSRVFWFTLEFGVVREAGEPRAYGAGLLSSFGEIDAFRDAELRPWDIEAMGTTQYDISHYHPVLYEAPSFADLVRD
ncbi:MAG: phenylalanine 4-monooxygenase, partial [Acidimicrobiales bacterium]